VYGVLYCNYYVFIVCGLFIGVHIVIGGIFVDYYRWLLLHFLLYYYYCYYVYCVILLYVCILLLLCIGCIIVYVDYGIYYYYSCILYYLFWLILYCGYWSNCGNCRWFVITWLFICYYSHFYCCAFVIVCVSFPCSLMILLNVSLLVCYFIALLRLVVKVVLVIICCDCTFYHYYLLCVWMLFCWIIERNYSNVTAGYTSRCIITYLLFIIDYCYY